MKPVKAQQPLVAPDITYTTRVTATVDVPIIGGEGNDLRPQIKEWLQRHLQDTHVPIHVESFDIVDVTYNTATVSVTYQGDETEVTEYIQQQLGAPITSVGSKKGWRSKLAVLETPNKGFTEYKGKTQTLPNHAEFKKDLYPTKGDAAKKEIEAYKEGNRLMEADKRNEDTIKAGSPLMSENVKRYDLLKHNKEEQVLPKYAAKKSWRKALSAYALEDTKIVKCPHCGYATEEVAFIPVENTFEGSLGYDCPQCGESFPRDADATYPLREDDILFASKHSFIEKEKGGYMVKSETGKNLRKHPTTKEKAVKQLQAIEINKHKEGSWRNIFKKEADVSFKNKPDGTIVIDVSSHPNEPLAQNPNTLQPQPPGPAEVQQNESETGNVTEASLKKKV